MNFEINNFLIVFIILIIFVVIVYPISGYVQQKRLKASFSRGENKKLNWYHELIIWAWIPVFAILILIPLSHISLYDIGFKRIDFGASSFNKWIVFSSIGFYVFYFLYNAYSILILTVSKESRAKSAGKIPKDFRIFLPITKEEKRTWDYVAISAGITEEVIYRGYLFYALAMVFPGLSLVLILLISTLLFGIGHIYQGTEAIKPTIVGLIFGFLYIVFNSIIPIIIIHIAQDLVVRNLLDDENNNAN